MKKNARLILSGLLALALAAVACNLTIPGSGAIDSAATAVAGTVNALAGTAADVLTAMPHDPAVTETPAEELPTLAPPPAAAPLRVAFAAPDGNLYTWAEGMGSPLLLVSSGDICCTYVSPDGLLIAFTRYDSNYQFIALEVINADGSNRRTLLDAAAMAAFARPPQSIGCQPGQIRWVPGSHTLAFNTLLLFEGPGQAFYETLYLLNTDTGAVSNLLNTGTESWKFFYSPDGSKIAVTTPTGINLFAADGSLIQSGILSYGFINTASEYAWVAMPVWSSDGVTLAAAIPPVNPWDEPPGETSIHRLAYDGAAHETLLSAVMPGLAANVVAFSSDFNLFTYYTKVPGSTDGSVNLNIGYADGSPSTVYTSGNFAQDPLWSPDNGHFFYSLGGGNTNYPYMGQVGAAPVAITDYTNAMDAQWIDANHYLVVSNNAGVSRLLLGTIGAPTQLIYDHGVMSSNFLTYSVNR